MVVSAHTPGPWVTGSGGFESVKTPGPNGRPIALVAGETQRWPFREGEMLANARLIAAAPDLLEAVRDAIETIHEWHGDVAWDLYQHSPEMKRLNAAIAKVEGREP